MSRVCKKPITIPEKTKLTYTNRVLTVESGKGRLTREINPEVEAVLIDLIFDPQTSGGLVISIGPDQADACLKELQKKEVQSAAIIGEVVGPHPNGRLQIA